MKIAHVTATFPPYWGGTGNVAYHNARELHRRGHQVTVFTARSGNDGDLAFPFPVRRLPVLFRIGNAPLTPALLSALRGFDVIHLHYPFIFGADLVALAARRYRTPLVITYHNDLLAGGLRGRLFTLYTHLNQRWILRRADRLATTSRDYALHSGFTRTAPQPEAAAVIPNGVDLDVFHPCEQPSGKQPSAPQEAAWRAQLGLPEGVPVVLFVGGLDRAHHFKGLGVLLDAMAGLEDAHLLVVGAGELQADYQQQAEARSPGRVHFVGKVPLERLVTLYRNATVTVLPSITQGEAFGMVLAESMACGTPVVASDLPGVRTVVIDGETGFLARPGDAADLRAKLELLLDDPARATAMGQAGHAHILQHYTWEIAADALEQIYQELT